jgi:hypothetical protein
LLESYHLLADEDMDDLHPFQSKRLSLTASFPTCASKTTSSGLRSTPTISFMTKSY